jgi:hypothetical protein
MRYDAEDGYVWLRRWELIKLFFGKTLAVSDWDTRDVIQLSLFNKETQWRINISHDLNAYHSLDVEEELARLLAEELKK